MKHADSEASKGYVIRRFSFLWWLVVLPTTVTVGGTTFLILVWLTEWSAQQRLVGALILTLGVEFAIAWAVQARAPTRIRIGPGESNFVEELPFEDAVVVDGFEATLQGRVNVRGETWAAERSDDDSRPIKQGMNVRVLDRDGLKLIVSARG